MEKISTDKKEEWSLPFKVLFITLVLSQVTSLLIMILSLFEITVPNFSGLFEAYTRIFLEIILNLIILVGIKKTFKKMDKEGYHLLIIAYLLYLITIMSLTFSEKDLFHFKSIQFIPVFESLFNIDYIFANIALLTIIVAGIYMGFATKSGKSPF